MVLGSYGRTVVRLRRNEVKRLFVRLPSAVTRRLRAGRVLRLRLRATTRAKGKRTTVTRTVRFAVVRGSMPS